MIDLRIWLWIVLIICIIILLYLKTNRPEIIGGDLPDIISNQYRNLFVECANTKINPVSPKPFMILACLLNIIKPNEISNMLSISQPAKTSLDWFKTSLSKDTNQCVIARLTNAINASGSLNKYEAKSILSTQLLKEIFNKYPTYDETYFTDKTMFDVIKQEVSKIPDFQGIQVDGEVIKSDSGSIVESAVLLDALIPQELCFIL